MEKKALITGITGQDGSFLAELLLEKGYQVHGMYRPSSTPHTIRLHPLLEKYGERSLFLHYGDLTDGSSLFKLLSTLQPDEVYNLAAQTNVAISFENPEYTADVNGLGALRLLEALRLLKLKSRFYQASTSELFGAAPIPQRETTPFYPRSPYAAAKLYAYWMTINYREAYQMFACNGILFNHESSQRGETFVTRKITRALGRVCAGLQECLYLGNLNSLRDWGHARDFVEMQWRILQQEAPDDYVISTGEQHSVREFVTLAAQEMGISLAWEGENLQEIGRVEHASCATLTPGTIIVRVAPRFFRPSEVENLLGDSTKAFRKLNWRPQTSFQELVSEMARADWELAQNERKALLC